MPLLDIATAQVSLQARLVPLRAQPFLHCKLFSSPFICGHEKRLLSVSRLFNLQKRIDSLDSSSRLVVKAVATLEPKSLTRKQDGRSFYENAQFDGNSNHATTQIESAVAESEELDERERLRRMRISKANKGNTPWNKGRKHSAETLKRIRERTRLAMQDPKVKMKLANLGHAQSKETRVKIGVGVRLGWQKRREKLMVQEGCLFEWQNLIADASRCGFAGEEELQWDSYKILNEKLEFEWVESVEKRKTMQRPKGSRRAPKSREQRRKIAEAIAAKWADPEYRERVCSGLSRYHGTPIGVERKFKTKPSGTTQSNKRNPVKRKIETNNSAEVDNITPIQRLKLRRGNKPLYKDPMASSKLELIKNIRAQRADTETKKIEAIRRARLLIAEAEKAAKALEVAATTNLTARASLMETRKLIVEAVQSIQSINVGYDTVPVESLTPTELNGEIKNEIEIVNGRHSSSKQTGEVNGTKILQEARDKDVMHHVGSLTNFTLHDMLNGGKDLLTAYGQLPSINGKHLLEEKKLEANGNSTKPEPMSPQPNGVVVVKQPSKSKRWIRGRLVEVIEEN